MFGRLRRITILTCLVLFTAISVIYRGAQAHPQPGQSWAAEAFRLTWERTDGVVASGGANYSWFWGPVPRSAPLLERNDDSPGGARLVQYYDKGRLELPVQSAAAQSTRQLTFGRLVAEMISGNVQYGSQRYENGAPALIPVAGDANDPLAPTYASFAGVTGPVPAATGSRRAQSIDRTGTIFDRPELGSAYSEATNATYDDVTGHNIPRVFVDFMQRRGRVNTPNGQRTEQLVDPLAVFGRPMTEAYWADTTIDGRLQPVLVQLFERRVLTFNPANPAATRVELGNAGLHYYNWRYGGVQPRDGRRTQLLSHFETGAQTLTGGYWFSFDDRGNGGSSTASDRLIGPGFGNSVQALRFDYSVTDAIPFSFAALAVNLNADGVPLDLRDTAGIGFWARGTGGRMSLQVSSALTDEAYSADFTVPSDWAYVEVPLSSLQHADGTPIINEPQALSTATRVSLRPTSRPSAGFIDIDNLMLVSGKIAPTPEPGLPLVDDFEDSNLTSVLNTEWFTYDDHNDGGNSVAELAVVSPGFKNSSGALRFRGSFNKGWAKTSYLGMGVPLAKEGATLDLTDYSAIELSIRTDGQPYRLQLTSKVGPSDNQYGIVLAAPAEWTTLRIPFSLLTPVKKEGSIPFEVARTQIESIIITPLNQPQAFQLLIDDVKLIK